MAWPSIILLKPRHFKALKFLCHIVSSLEDCDIMVDSWDSSHYVVLNMWSAINCNGLCVNTYCCVTFYHESISTTNRTSQVYRNKVAYSAQSQVLFRMTFFCKKFFQLYCQWENLNSVVSGRQRILLGIMHWCNSQIQFDCCFFCRFWLLHKREETYLWLTAGCDCCFYCVWINSKMLGSIFTGS